MISAALSDLTLQAIRKALTRVGEMRLRTAKVHADSLLSGAAKSKAVNSAETECSNPELGLFDLRMVTEKKTTVAYARVTPKGLERLLQVTPADGYAELLQSAAAEHRPAIQSAIAASVETQLRNLDQERAGIAEKQTVLLDQLRRVIESGREALQAEAVALNQRRRRLEELLVFAPLPEKADGEPDTSRPVQLSGPKNEVEADYQRRMCDQLAEEYNDSPASRDAIERVFFITSAMNRAGEVGTEVSFDGRFHQSESKVLPNTKCRITTPGWVYETPSGKPSYLVKITVDPIPAGGES